MKSPLALDQETVKKYSIPKEVELHPRQKKAFLEEQLQQLKALHWRARVDMLHAKRLSEDDNDVLKNKGLQNYSQHLNEVQQTIGGIQMVQQLLDELNAQHPEVDAGEHPEG